MADQEGVDVQADPQIERNTAEEARPANPVGQVVSLWVPAGEPSALGRWCRCGGGTALTWKAEWMRQR